MWLTVYEPPPKQGQAADRFSGPALAPHEIYVRGKAIRTLFDGLATRNYRVGLFETALGASQEGDSCVVNCIPESAAVPACGFTERDAMRPSGRFTKEPSSLAKFILAE